MGSVAIDLYKRQREYQDLTLSDEDVVKYLILEWSKINVSYGASVNINIYQAGDTFDFNQELIALYASLDVIIRKMELKEKEEIFLKLIFEGHTISDIIRIYKYPRKTAYRMLDRIVSKVVKINNDDWYYAMGHNGHII